MEEATGVVSPPLDIDGIVVDLHTNRATAATAARALLNENLNLPMLYTSSSESEVEQFDMQRNPLHGPICNDDASATTTSGRPASPPPNCAICLGRCKNKCFTNSCIHQFCFKCLAEWSKVKAECPLCKQQFRSIIYNVKSMDQFEEYHVQTPTVQVPHNPLEVTYQGQLRGFSVNTSESSFYNFSMRSYQRNNHDVQPRNVPIRIRNYGTNFVGHEFGGNDVIPSAVIANTSMPLRAHILRRHMPDNDLPVAHLWRRYIYERKLYALPVSDITGRFRECSARFYRANPGQIVRLIPFANRDLVCLLRNTNHSVTRVLEALNEGLEMSNILSRSFRRRLQPYLGERTAHFIHELSNFARSPYDMIGYDENVQYAPQHIDEEQVIEFSSSGGEETNNNNNNSNNNNNNNTNSNINNNNENNHTSNADENATSTSNDNRGAVASRRQARRLAQAAANNLNLNATPATSYSPLSLLSFTITTTTEGSEAPGVSVAVSAGSRGGHAQVAAINLSTHNRAHNEVVIDLDDTIEVSGNSNGNGNAGTNGNAGNSSTSNTSVNITANADGPIVVVNADNSTTVTTNNNGTADAATSTNCAPAVVSIALSTSSSDECEFVLERKPPHLRTPEMVSLNSESDSDVVFIEEIKPILAEATYSTSDDNDDNRKMPSLARLMAEQEQQRMDEASTSTGVRSRAVRRIVAAKRSSANSNDLAPANKKRRTRLQPSKMTQDGGCGVDSTTTNDTNSDGTASNDNDSDFAIVSHRRPTIRFPYRRGSSTARKSRKRPRTSVVKIELPKVSNELSNNSQPDENDKRLPRLRRRLRQKSTKRRASSSTENESTTDEEDKVTLKTWQRRLKISLSDAEANIAEQALDEADNDHNNFPLAYSPQISDEFMAQNQNVDVADGDGDGEGDNGNDNADVPTLKADGQHLSTNLCSDHLDDERPTTSAAAAAAAAASVAKKSTTRNLSTQEDSVIDRDEDDNESKTATTLHTNPYSPAAQNANYSNYYRPIYHSPTSTTTSNSSPDSFQLPSTSRECRNGEQNTARFKYSSSSDSSIYSSSSSSCSASRNSASEDELN